MTTVMIAVISLAVGLALGVVYSTSTIRLLRRRLKEVKTELKSEVKTVKKPKNFLKSVTRLIFVTTQVSALVWVFMSYGIAIYSTVFLQQVYTMAELSEPAIHTILGVGVLKVLENIFEHNDGPVFGRSKQEEYSPPEGGDTEV